MRAPRRVSVRHHRREKVFGPGRAVPLDRNQKARIQAYAKAWSRRHQQPRQHKGPITRAFTDVLRALLWGFHNAHTGRCFPSYEMIAAKAECCRDTVAEALKALEWAGILSWQHRITRAVVRQRDLFGRWSNRWTVLRTSNAYVFHDPQPRLAGAPAAWSENPGRTQDQGSYPLLAPPVVDANSPLERALHRFGVALGVKDGIEQGEGAAGAS
jgi:helix-turn-helix protein